MHALIHELMRRQGGTGDLQEQANVNALILKPKNMFAMSLPNIPYIPLLAGAP